MSLFWSVMATYSGEFGTSSDGRCGIGSQIGCIAPLFGRAQLFDPVFRPGSRSAVRMGFNPQQQARWMRTGIPSPVTAGVSGVSRGHVRRDAGVNATVGTLDQVEKPGLHGRPG